MASVNKVILIGRLGADPVMKHTNGGLSVANFSVATDRQWVDRDGEKRRSTQWTRIVTWEKLAERCIEYLVKGQMVYIEGRLDTNSWEDREGIKRWSTDVVASDVQFLDRPRGIPALPAAPPDQQDFGDDGIPF